MFTGVTPESLIPRSDSRNPATTCKGLTQSGRPCKRPIDAKEPEGDGVLAVTSVAGDDSGEEIGAAAYFCWQHKDQAETLAAKESTGPETQLYPLKERSSIDTLVQRLGVLDIEEPNEAAPRKRRSSGHRRRSGSRPPRRINRPPTWDAVQGPLMSIPSDVMADRKRRDRPSKSAPPVVKKLGFWASLCCGSADEEVTEPTRHKKKTEHQPPAGLNPTQTETPMQDIPQPQSQPPQPPRAQGQSRKSSSQHSRPSSSRKPLSEKPARPVNKSNNASSDSETATLLRYIPTSVPPKLASTLLAELSKPISPHDEEGFIYIFWLTPEAAGPAPASAASNLLAPRGEGSRRRTSDVMRQYSVKEKKGEKAGGDKGGKETILLKIGRANNVHRRMNEWTRQCGYSLSLVRYYPHVSSATPSPAGSRQASHQGRGSTGGGGGGASGGGLQAGGDGAAAGVRKVPHAHRVERMIHLELGEQRVIKQCEACGKSHKEWFEVEATREGIKKVDEVVKRWVEWAEKRNE
ncbi:meiotically up-regulated gene 113-domain-containing protein [Bipolaris maydis]|uniref:meiotically up-regulated gene 113-domain-containing protein n=1 Tax=Cochliobolus heterostrophus TaxID=5016 RepID=UPI0024DB468C|nr:hypothetical protein BM1_08026 [Bipolaris maydis]KAJ5020662.1 meiotically up-regulated gene 113-domain-containing protein [Bipolaris maydis]KAJ5020687.1 meiotically up-regulated gene 113-domain-containing protein [Bipolaris maydis]KAJ5020741.1 meiotically up-regulated gene 113-domain-containing protein [Bipolaris maydis]KAJ5021028.1 meiotically up-regulated gene 113-domain-containing protein [Bipolaris maydis]